jgi:AhpD family alkylhydroperoxidase
MPNEAVLQPKEKTLIALGASVASGCQPCTEFQVRASRDAGACDRGIALAVETALAVRESATRSMDRWSARCQGARPQVDAEFRDARKLLAELTAVAASVCVNSVPDAIIHLAAAKQLGAAAEQIRVAVAIARAVRSAAEQKLEAALAAEIEGIEAVPAASSCCGSASAGGAPAPGGAGDCGCR